MLLFFCFVLFFYKFMSILMYNVFGVWLIEDRSLISFYKFMNRGKLLGEKGTMQGKWRTGKARARICV